MFTTSQDLLYIVLSLCILWFTVFLCWLLYQAGRVLRNANRIVENVIQKLELISDAVSFIREKVDGISSHMGVMGGMVASLVEKFLIGKLTKSFEEKNEAKKTKKKRKVEGDIDRE